MLEMIKEKKSLIDFFNNGTIASDESYRVYLCSHIASKQIQIICISYVPYLNNLFDCLK